MQSSPYSLAGGQGDFQPCRECWCQRELSHSPRCRDLGPAAPSGGWATVRRTGVFLRTKTVSGKRYLQIVENRWDAGKVRQRVIASLGRLGPDLAADPKLTGLLASARRLAASVAAGNATEAPSAAPEGATGWARDRETFSLDSYLPYRIERLSQVIGEGSARFYRQHGIATQDWRVLVLLHSYGRLTASELVDRGTVPKAGISRAVARLTERGLVQGQADTADARRVNLCLTREGRDFVERFLPYNLARQERLLAALAPEEQAQLDRILCKLQSRAAEMAGTRDGLGSD
ncbi:hypothetical protein C2I36_14615 [Rhodobacteraceae bacterium WD3A24]|nr:hypothetical protein C2I36_14615 [Rhodobacteraceae bacterium WD3A24]